jgi:hypothetical protein
MLVKRLRGHPGFDLRAAEAGVYQADGYIQRAVKLASEEIRHGGKFRRLEGLGRAGDPLQGLATLFRLPVVRHLKKPDFRMLRRGQLFGGVVRRLLTFSGAEGLFHVGLAGAEPHFTHQDVAQHQPIFAAHRQLSAHAVGP